MVFWYLVTTPCENEHSKHRTNDAVELAPGLASELVLAPDPLRPDQHPAAVYLARLAPGSRASQRSALEQIAELLRPGLGVEALPWWQLRYQHTRAVATVLAERYAPASANRMLCALRGVLGEAWRLGQMSAEEHARAVDLRPVRGSRLPRGRALGDGELSALVDACDPSTRAGARDRALVSLLCGAGLRRAEVVGLDLVHLQRERGELVGVRVRGKGNKERAVPLPDATGRALAAWLTVRGAEPGPLFLPLARGGAPVRRRLSGGAVRAILQTIAARAGVGAFSPHDMRRTYVSTLLDEGVDIATVQKLAGHASVQTTARYDRRGEAAMRRAVGRLRVPG